MRYVRMFFYREAIYKIALCYSIFHMQIRSILLIISGSVSAYKALELIRQWRKASIEVDVVLTAGGAQFITPLQISSLTGRPTYTDLFSLKDEVEMGHIALSRKNDAIVVAPASADLLAKMAAGLADDLASTCLLATDKPVFIAPAMNHHMWRHAATQRNIAQLQADGVTLIAPEVGEMACGEHGIGRLAGLDSILAALRPQNTALSGMKAVVTAGPTHEPIDPVRYIGNHSSGKQGIAIAQALAKRGAQVALILGPTSQPPVQHPSIHVTPVTTAQQMFAATKAALPADIAICTAAVADWRVEAIQTEKIKKSPDGTPPPLAFTENPDILRWLSQEATPRPSLVIGFAAETENLLVNAAAKHARKGCDWLLANDVSEGRVFGADETQLHLLPHVEQWQGSKHHIAETLTDTITHYFTSQKGSS